MKRSYLTISLLLLIVINRNFAQDNANVSVYSTPTNPCGIYNKENIGSRHCITYTHLREGDVSWEKRIWRDIDLREKQNQFLYYPIELNACRTSLFQTLTKQILANKLIAFADEEFLIPYSLSAIRKRLVKIDTIEKSIYNDKGEESIVRVPFIDSTSIYERVLKFRIKEDWFFDRQKSSLEVRIIGIAAYEYLEEKEGFKELFWVYFPACRPYFAVNDIYNFKNDAERRSLDDIFWKRQFTSTITKESNVQDRYIEDYQKGIDALVEADNIKLEVFKWEHDLWNY